MARITLKVPKPVDPNAPPKAPTSRAIRAQRGKVRGKLPVVPVVAAPATPARAPKVAANGTGERAANPKASRSRRGAKPSAHPAGKTAPTGTAKGKPPRPGGYAGRPADAGRARGDTAGKADAARSDIARADPTPVSAMPARRESGRRFAPSTQRGAPATIAGRDSKSPDTTPPRAPRQAVAPSQPDSPRLSKRMGELGLCSRREADDWIANGWVKVDGVVVDTLGTRVSPTATIEIDPAASRYQMEQVTILLNKPIGYVSGQAEDGHQPAMLLIKPENHWADDPSPIRFKLAHLRGLAPAGRLDIDSTGLIVFTQDGRVAKQLIGSETTVEKEYLVRVEGKLSPEGMKLLHHGLELDGVALKPAKVSWQNEDQLRFVLREGRKRQIRRMCEAVGLVVVGLKRVRSGGVPLGPLPLGQWRYLRRDEKF